MHDMDTYTSHVYSRQGRLLRNRGVLRSEASKARSQLSSELRDSQRRLRNDLTRSRLGRVAEAGRRRQVGSPSGTPSKKVVITNSGELPAADTA